MMQAKTKPKTRVTIPQLVQICKRLKDCPTNELGSLAAEYGLIKHDVNILRSMLGYVSTTHSIMAPEMAKNAMEELKQGVTVPELARKYGVNKGLIYQMGRRLGIETNSKLFWTERKIMTVCLAIKNNDPDNVTAMKLGCNINMYRGMKYRIQRKTHCKKWLETIEKMGL